MTKEEATEKAVQWMHANDNAFVFRSCWNCNSSHEHLKEAECVILCFGCGCCFFKGIDITVEEDEEGKVTGEHEKETDEAPSS